MALDDRGIQQKRSQLVACHSPSSPLSLICFLLGYRGRQNCDPRLRECCRQVEAEEVSKSRNKIHQTWGPKFCRRWALSCVNSHSTARGSQEAWIIQPKYDPPHLPVEPCKILPSTACESKGPWYFCLIKFSFSCYCLILTGEIVESRRCRSCRL